MTDNFGVLLTVAKEKRGGLNTRHYKKIQGSRGARLRPKVQVNVALASRLSSVFPRASLLFLLFAQGGILLQRGCQLVLHKGRQLFGSLFEKRATWMGTVHMQVQVLLGGARVAAILTHIELVPTLLVGILLLYPMDLLQVGLQGTSLGEGFVTHLAFVGANACVCAYMPLQVEGVVEALAAEGAQVPLYLVVALKVTVEHALQTETLAAQVTVVNHGVVARASGKLDF